MSKTYKIRIMRRVPHQKKPGEFYLGDGNLFALLDAGESEPSAIEKAQTLKALLPQDFNISLYSEEVRRQSITI